jgi:hypothetical protein
MIRIWRVLPSIVIAAAVYSCDGHVEIGTGSQDSDASVTPGTSLEAGVPVVSYETGAPDTGVVDRGVDPVTGTLQCPNVSITVGASVPRYLPGGDSNANLFPLRPENLNPTALDYSDCISNINLQFTLLMGGLPCTDTIQVWAGPSDTDCTQSTARMSSDGDTQCWPVTPIGFFEMAQTSTANIRAQDIVAHVGDSSISSTYTAATSAACEPLARGSCELIPLGLYFMAVEADGVTVDNSAMYSLDAEPSLPDGGSCP